MFIECRKIILKTFFLILFVGVIFAQMVEYKIYVNKESTFGNSVFSIEQNDEKVADIIYQTSDYPHRYDLSEKNCGVATGMLKKYSTFALMHAEMNELIFYDKEVNYIGLVHGEYFQDKERKDKNKLYFPFYDNKNNNNLAKNFAIAIFDKKTNEFNIYKEDEKTIVGRFIDSNCGYWKVSYEKEFFDDRIMKIFGAFVVHYRDNFKSDGKK